jgi:hypothetical protein
MTTYSIFFPLFFSVVVFGIRDGKKSVSGINILDPQHCGTAEKTLDIPFYMYKKYLDGLL